MFQKEVAERIVAKPGGDHYGRLALLAQYRSRRKDRDDAAARGLYPAPKVHSAVVHLTALPQPRAFPVTSRSCSA
jgi:16S rRNA (adenine1518-N6/adenine1519-N6)-dimethyltransferase